MTRVTQAAPPRTSGSFALLFISERDFGKKFVLQPNAEVIIGRGTEAKLQLSDRLSSRRHARLSTKDGVVSLEDLGSTNGTFVNGRRVQRALLKKGDHILIGTQTFEFLADGVAGPEAASAATPSKNGESAEWETTLIEPAPGRVITGSIGELPLVDLLQLLSHTRKSGVLTVRSDRAVGRIYLREGRIFSADINGSCAVDPKRTLYRILRWSKGTFELGTLRDPAVKEEIKEMTEALLLEGAWQHDELIKLEDKLPKLDTKLALANPLPGQLCDLTPDEINICQLVLEHATQLKVIDQFKGSDLDAYRTLCGLLERKFVCIG
jgi:pSer/pThr/pTyr-binding forkhead associated (FHA) protein